MIFAIVAGVLLLWLIIWPIAVTRVIYSTNAVLTWLRWHIGSIALLVTGAFAVGLWVALVNLSDDVHWGDANAPLGALALSAAIAFTYGNLAPPAVTPRFIAVDEATGFLAPVVSAKIKLKGGRFQPVALGVWNVGSTSWNSYRINAEFPGGTELALTHPEVLISFDWDWAPESAAFGKQKPWIQVDRGQTIAPAEPALIRFVVKPPGQPGTYDVQITVGCGGRLGETRATVKFAVV